MLQQKKKNSSKIVVPVLTRFFPIIKKMSKNYFLNAPITSNLLLKTPYDVKDQRIPSTQNRAHRFKNQQNKNHIILKPINYLLRLKF